MKRSEVTPEVQQGKSYFSIGEVADMFEVSIEVLRKWENDFPRVLKPQRTKKDTRLYSRKDIEKVALIHRLLRVEGLTIAGAKARLEKRQTPEEIKQEVISQLRDIRNRLQGIVDEIDEASRAQRQPGFYVKLDESVKR